MTPIKVGDKVRLKALPSFVKTAEPMPMLRSPEILKIGDSGIITERRPGGYWGVKFDYGAFLLDTQYLEVIN
jgi:hypothetical protein